MEFGDADTIEYSGSIELADARAVDLTVVTEGVPASAFALSLQLQQSLDNLSFFDIGSALEVDEAHCLNEALAVAHHLSPCGAILIDDTAPASDGRFAGKGAQVVPALIERGFRLRWAEGSQVLLSRT
jgi:hypothetical protein